jgi:hypothetical protein
VPIGQRYAVKDLMAAMRRHAARQGGPVNVAWVLMAGINTGPRRARALARLLDGTPVRVSVIDVNDPDGPLPARVRCGARDLPFRAGRGRAVLRPAVFGGADITLPAECWRHGALGLSAAAPPSASSTRAQKFAIAACSFAGVSMSDARSSA